MEMGLPRVSTLGFRVLGLGFKSSVTFLELLMCAQYSVLDVEHKTPKVHFPSLSTSSPR